MEDGWNNSLYTNSTKTKERITTTNGSLVLDKSSILRPKAESGLSQKKYTTSVIRTRAWGQGWTSTQHHLIVKPRGRNSPWSPGQYWDYWFIQEDPAWGKRRQQKLETQQLGKQTGPHWLQWKENWNRIQKKQTSNLNGHSNGHPKIHLLYQ